MQKCLYLLCPTDCLETVINNTFGGENYFYTSLGNSVVFNRDTINKIISLINKHDIKEVFFVLSNSNHFILDALEKNNFSKKRGLNSLYKEIKINKKNSEFLWQTNYNQDLVLSYYLNSKIKELQHNLINTTDQQLKIKAKIYDRYQRKFKNVYSDLLCLETYYLN